jgi:hypothetical protein
VGVKLVVEVLDHAPDAMTTVDRLLLVIIAENANDGTREGWPGWELLARRMRWNSQKDGGKNAVSTALAGMAKRGVDVRVSIAHGKDGRPVYAATGRRTVYRIPLLQRVAAVATLPAKDPAPVTPEGWHSSPPLKGGTLRHPGWQSEGVKGGNPGGRRVAPTATPSPQEPSENPQPRLGFGRIETPLPEAAQIILDGLRHGGYPNVTATDARAVHTVVAAKYAGRVNLGYLRTMASNQSFGPFMEEIRATRAEQVEAEIRELQRTQPGCEHGTAAGRTPHPTNGVLLCPFCRTGAPVPRPSTERTHPALRAALDAYREHTTGALPAATLIQITREAAALRSRGLPDDQLADLARKAARNSTGLLEAAIAN